MESFDENTGEKNTISSHYSAVLQSLRSVFRRRIFHAVSLDEFNTFRLLPALLRPMQTKDPRTETHLQICAAVSTIPFKTRDVPPSEVTKHLNFIHQRRENSLGFDALSSSYVAAWKVKANPPDLISENFHTQFSSPSAMLARREGSLMEHAMLLCSLLLGIGANAYVAIGNIKRRCYIWVIVIYSKREQDKVIKRSHFADTGSDESKISQFDQYTQGSNTGKQTFHRQQFERFKLVNDIKTKNNDFIITHYDAASGIDFHVMKDLLFEEARFKSNPISSSLLTASQPSSITKTFGLMCNTQICLSSKSFLFWCKTNLISSPMFSWDVSNDDFWFPLLNKRTPIAPGSLQCFYMSPEFVNHFEYKLDYLRMDEAYVIKSLTRAVPCLKSW